MTPGTGPAPVVRARRTDPETAMSPRTVWLIAAALIAVDLLFFMVPIVPFAAAYVLLARPAWFKDFVDDLYAR